METSADHGSAPSSSSARAPLSAVLRLTVAAAMAAVAAVGCMLSDLDTPTTVLVGLATFFAAFAILGWWALWPLGAAATQQHSRRETLPSALQELLLCGVSIGGVVGIAMVLVRGGGGDNHWQAGLALFGVFGGWASLQVMYAARYAYLFHTSQVDRPIDFNMDQAPDYRDFFYFSFNLGMTYQVSDTAVRDREIRSVVLRHSLVSYLFGALILGSTVNLVAQVAIG